MALKLWGLEFAVMRKVEGLTASGCRVPGGQGLGFRVYRLPELVLVRPIPHSHSFQAGS